MSGEERGLRLDVFIASKLRWLSRSYVQKLIEWGDVKVNGRVKKAHYQVKVGNGVEVEIPPPIVTSLEAEPIPLDILYEDEHILVINKPAGLVVHPAGTVKAGALVNAILAHCGQLPHTGDELRPGIVHRLDKDTSGILVVAKTGEAYQGLVRQVQGRKMGRKYITLVEGSVAVDHGIVDAPIGRDLKDRKKFSVSVVRGKPALTEFWVKGRYGDFTLLEVKLHSGRTHQIRVHMAYLGNPVVGDSRYGKGAKGNKGLAALIGGLGGQALHAKELGLVHPKTGEYMRFSAPLPVGFCALLEFMRGNYGSDKI